MSAKDASKQKKKTRHSFLSWNCCVSSAFPVKHFCIYNITLREGWIGASSHQTRRQNYWREKFDLATARRRHVKGKLALGNLRVRVSEIQMDSLLNSCPKRVENMTLWKFKTKKVSLLRNLCKKKSLSICNKKIKSTNPQRKLCFSCMKKKHAAHEPGFSHLRSIYDLSTLPSVIWGPVRYLLDRLPVRVWYINMN